MSKTAKFITNLWLARFKEELETLENGPNTPFTQLQKEAVISQIQDLTNQLADLAVSKNTTPPAPEKA